MDLITLAKRGTCMKRSENFCISLCEHRNILINKQNTCEQSPFMNYCMIFHYNTHICKHVFQQHRLLAWLKYAVVCFSMNVSKVPRVCLCVCVCVYVCGVHLYSSDIAVQQSCAKKCNCVSWIDYFNDRTALKCRYQ